MYEPWEDLVQSSITEYSTLNVTQNQINHLKLSFIDILANYNEIREICKWAKTLNIDTKTMSDNVI